MSSTMTVTLAATPGPSARITITGIVGAASVQIFRGDGAQEVRVAGDDLQIPAGAVYITDYRLPPGRTATYRAVLYSSLGVVTESVSAAPLAVPELAQCTAWVMDPEDPTTAMLVTFMDGTNAQVGHQSAGVVANPLQGLPIWLGGPRTRLARSFVIGTTTAAEATQFQQMIEPGGQLLIRPDAGIRHNTGLIYMGAGSIPEAPWNAYEESADWTIDGTEVADDEWPVVVAERTWLDVEAECATWLEVEAMWATWLAVEIG